MKAQELLNETLNELEVEEQINIDGGSAASRAHGASLIYAGIMNSLGYSCSEDWIGMTNCSYPTQSGRCTG